MFGVVYCTTRLLHRSFLLNPPLQQISIWIHRNIALFHKIPAVGCVSQDGAPTHWGLMVRDFLNETFPNRWIGKSGPTPWPPRSPDIISLDFFCGVCKRQSVQNTSDIKTSQSRILNVLAKVKEEMLENTRREIEYCLDILRTTNGPHVEVHE